jgi:hypothetical protein
MPLLIATLEIPHNALIQGHMKYQPGGFFTMRRLPEPGVVLYAAMNLTALPIGETQVCEIDAGTQVTVVSSSVDTDANGVTHQWLVVTPEGSTQQLRVEIMVDENWTVCFYQVLSSHVTIDSELAELRETRDLKEVLHARADNAGLVTVVYINSKGETRYRAMEYIIDCDPADIDPDDNEDDLPWSKQYGYECGKELYYMGGRYNIPRMWGEYHSHIFTA